MKIRQEKGSAMLMAMFVIIICTLMLSSILMATAGNLRLAGMDRNWNTAQYAAEAGAKVGIDQILTRLQAMNYVITSANISTLNITASTPATLPNGASYTWTAVTQDNAGNSMNPSNVSQIRIQAVGTVSGSTYTSTVVVALANSTMSVPVPGVVDLFNNANFSRQNPNKNPPGNPYPWNVIQGTNTSPAHADPPGRQGHYQVKFGDVLSENFTISYNAACENFPGYNDPSGYGIYYGMTGTADNPDAYVFQYDPGAGANGSFFVKRVKSRTSTPANSYDNEWDPNTNKYYNQQGTGCDVAFEKNDASNTVRVDLKGGKPSYGQLPSLEYSMNTSLYQYYLSKGSLPGSVNSVTKFITWCNSNHPDWLFNITTPHSIKIQVENGVHKIYCDGVLILNFTDNSKYGKKNFAGTSTGLRTWNADIRFSNDPNQTVGQKTASTIIWKK